MKLRIIERGMRARVVEAESLVVYADDGATPLAVAVRHGGDAHFVATCADPLFNDILRNLGVTGVAVVVGSTPTIESVPQLEGAVRL